MGGQVLAFDFGLKRIGVAAGNREFSSSSAISTLSARDGVPDWQQIQNLISQWSPTHLVVGLPLNMDDSEGEMAERARRFARRLQGRFALPVDLVDERLSSNAARQSLLDAGMKPAISPEAIDRLAAKHILDTWLEEQRGIHNRS